MDAHPRAHDQQRRLPARTAGRAPGNQRHSRRQRLQRPGRPAQRRAEIRHPQHPGAHLPPTISASSSLMTLALSARRKESPHLRHGTRRPALCRCHRREYNPAESHRRAYRRVPRPSKPFGAQRKSPNPPSPCMRWTCCCCSISTAKASRAGSETPSRNGQPMAGIWSLAADPAQPRPPAHSLTSCRLRQNDAQSIDNLDALARFHRRPRIHAARSPPSSRLASCRTTQRLLVSQDDIPLLVRRKHGAGIIEFSGSRPVARAAGQLGTG